LIVLGAAIAYAGAHTMTKQLTRTDGSLAILFWMSVIQLPLALGFIAFGDGWRMPAAADWPWIALVGFAALTAHFCMARALSVADAIVVMPLDFARLPLIALVGMLLYGEVVTIEVGIGAAIIAASLMYALRRERHA
jgi:drug/metabolite transporter (DMT)-like permease